MKLAHALVLCKLFIYSISIFKLLVKIRVVLLIMYDLKLSLWFNTTASTDSECKLQKVTKLASGDIKGSLCSTEYTWTRHVRWVKVVRALNLLISDSQLDSQLGLRRKLPTSSAQWQRRGEWQRRETRPSTLRLETHCCPSVLSGWVPCREGSRWAGSRGTLYRALGAADMASHLLQWQQSCPVWYPARTATVADFGRIHLAC